MIAKDPNISTFTADEVRRRQVEAELERILQSPGFRTSKRSQEFLRYIVTTALDGRFEELKERVIGNQVFQRLPDYDTGEHSIVRVKANELRKRLAQFYGETREPSIVEIHLPKGSYTPEYRWTETEYPDTQLIEPEKPRCDVDDLSLLVECEGLIVPPEHQPELGQRTDDEIDVF